MSIGVIACSMAGDPPSQASAFAARAPSPLRGVAGQSGATAREADPYVTARPIRAASIGHTSYVLKLTLEGGAVAAFKPRARAPRRELRYKGEIAAYRLAMALGLSNVPRAIPRSFAAEDLRAVRADFDEKGRVDDDGRVRGALIPWINGYRVLPLGDRKQRARWESWLFDAHVTIPDDQRTLAATVSTMLAFDYLTANWDRWSGGNVAQDGSGGQVLFVDNDGAFYECPAAATLAHQRAQLARVTRFSRSFVTALRALDAAALRRAIGEEAPGVPLLSERSVTGVELRRLTVLAIVDARVVHAGAAATLAFD
jgi:hypothetical protein